MTQTEHLVEELRSRLEALPAPTPVFDLHVGFAGEYDRLFSGDFSESAPASAILDRALNFGRLLLTGQGGGAKTVILTRIAKAAIVREIATILVTLKEWTSADNVDW